MNNTIILVDYDNVFVTLKNNYRDFRFPNIMYDVITDIRQKYSNDNIIIYKLFADFQKVHISNEGYEILKKNQVEIQHVFNGKNASDIILMLNCLKFMMQYPHIDKIVLISSDSDIMPIFHEIQLLNKTLEVIYFDINTGDEHKQHIQEAGITSYTLESLLNLQIYKIYDNSHDFYLSKSKDKIYFTKLLQLLNDIISSEYNQYLKYDQNGNIISGGGADLRKIIAIARENGILPELEFARNTPNNFFDMLLNKGILYQHNYTWKGKNFYTFLLSEKYLISENITIDNLKTENEY